MSRPNESTLSSAPRPDGRQRGKLQNSRNDRSIFPGVRIVVIAVQEHLIRQRADLVLRRLNQSQAQILGRVLDSVVVLRDFALRVSAP